MIVLYSSKYDVIKQFCINMPGNKSCIEPQLWQKIFFVTLVLSLQWNITV